MICHQIIDVAGTCCACISQIAHLDWSRTIRQNSRPAVRCVARQIDRDINLKRAQQMGHIGVAALANIYELTKGFF